MAFEPAIPDVRGHDLNPRIDHGPGALRDGGHTPADGRWAFDAETTRVFDNMLERSIPQYATMRSLVFAVGQRLAGQDGAVVDLGCSRGEALAPFAADEGRPCVGLEVSDPMWRTAYRRFEDLPHVSIRKHDLRDGLGSAGLSPDRPAALVLSVLTLMFVPVEHRPGLLGEVYDVLAPGGALILVEKTLGSTPLLHRVFGELYHAGKAQAGYTGEEIERKALALEGVLVPLTAAGNEELLRGAGFRQVETFWRCGPFAAWLAVK